MYFKSKIFHDPEAWICGPFFTAMPLKAFFGFLILYAWSF